MRARSLNAKSARELITSRGYWEVDMRPDEPSKDRFESISDCMNKVRESVVLLRGWDYPHFSTRDPPYPMQRRIEATVNFGYNKEYWTMFLNGHFYHLFACREDWLKENASLLRERGIFTSSRYDNIPPKTVLGFLMTLYSVTEIFEFAIRLAQKNVLGRTVRIQIQLSGMEKRRIISFARERHIARDYICREENITFDRRIHVEELIGRGHEMALNWTVNIFELFNWLKVSTEMLRDDQRKFLEKRL